MGKISTCQRWLHHWRACPAMAFVGLWRALRKNAQVYGQLRSRSRELYIIVLGAIPWLLNVTVAFLLSFCFAPTLLYKQNVSWLAFG